MESRLALLKERSQKADEMIALLRTRIRHVRDGLAAAAFAEEAARLAAENGALEKDVQCLVQRLTHAQTRNGVKQVPLRAATPQLIHNAVNIARPAVTPPSAGSNVGGRPAANEAPPPVGNQTPKEKKKGSKELVGGGGGVATAGGGANKKGGVSKDAGGSKEGGGGGVAPEPDVNQLDFRVGLIVSAVKHPDADGLYMEEVDVGDADGRRRTVVSGLVRHVPLEALQGVLAVLLCNLKPAKMRGVVSEAMVMCASSPDRVELLVPPPGAAVGDRVTCDGHDPPPPLPLEELNPKKKVWEKLAPHLTTDAQRVATFKGSPLRVEGKGVVTAPSMANTNIK